MAACGVTYTVAHRSEGPSECWYRAPKGSCAGCPFREQCSPSGRKETIQRPIARLSTTENSSILFSTLGKSEQQSANPHRRDLRSRASRRNRGLEVFAQMAQIQVWLIAAFAAEYPEAKLKRKSVQPSLWLEERLVCHPRRWHFAGLQSPD